MKRTLALAFLAATCLSVPAKAAPVGTTTTTKGTQCADYCTDPDFLALLTQLTRLQIDLAQERANFSAGSQQLYQLEKLIDYVDNQNDGNLSPQALQLMYNSLVLSNPNYLPNEQLNFINDRQALGNALELLRQHICIDLDLFARQERQTVAEIEQIQLSMALIYLAYAKNTCDPGNAGDVAVATQQTGWDTPPEIKLTPEELLPTADPDPAPATAPAGPMPTPTPTPVPTVPPMIANPSPTPVPTTSPFPMMWP